MNKYRNVKTEVDGIVFDSKKEARRYSELKILQRAGEIKDLTIKPVYPIEVQGEKVCKYIPDFQYYEGGKKIVEDVKGMRTQIYKLKKKLMKACYDVEVREI